MTDYSKKDKIMKGSERHETELMINATMNGNRESRDTYICRYTNILFNVARSELPKR